MADMPMPAPGGAPADQPPQDAGAPPDQGAAPDDANSPTKLIVGVDAGLSKVAQLLEGAQGIDPKIKQGVDQALQLYRSSIQSLMQQGPPGKDAGQPPAGAAPGGAPAAAGPKGGVMSEHSSSGSVPMNY